MTSRASKQCYSLQYVEKEIRFCYYAEEGKMKNENEKTTDEVGDKELENVAGGALSLGKPKDKYEKEADKTADRAMQGESAEGLIEPKP